MKLSGIFKAFVYIIPVLFILLFVNLLVGNITKSYVGEEVYMKYLKIERKCGRHNGMVCDRDIDKLNISQKEKEILYNVKYEKILFYLMLCLYVLVALKIHKSNEKYNKVIQEKREERFNNIK